MVSGDAVRGKRLIRAYGCGSCHTIPGVAGARAVVGPSLAGVADRAFIGGVVPNGAHQMVSWIQNPPALSPRTAMPQLDVTDHDARDIAAYLFTLQQRRWRIGSPLFGSGRPATQ